MNVATLQKGKGEPNAAFRFSLGGLQRMRLSYMRASSYIKGAERRCSAQRKETEMFAQAPLNRTFRESRAVERDTTYVRGFGSEFRERQYVRAGSSRIAGL